MTSKTTVIFATVIAAFAVSVAGFGTAHAYSQPYGHGNYDLYYEEYNEYDHFSWSAQGHKDMVWQATMVENAWKVGIISDADYFWELMSLFYLERQMTTEFGDYDWGDAPKDNKSADYLENVLKNPTAAKKIEALIASK